jgi:hypothetical protein
MNVSTTKRFGRICTTLMVGGGVLVTAILGAPVASAEDYGVDMAEQCAVQYPDGLAFFPAYASIVAPHNAYSWRCEQVSKLPGGGVISNLPVDVESFCTRHGLGLAVVLNADDAGSWRCRL